jgi:hypothetical protein
MQENIKFKEDINEIKNSTSIKKWFKKINPNVSLCFLSLPKRLQYPAIYISASVEKDIFYHKDSSPDIWSKNSINPYDIMSFCSGKFSSETTVYYYNKRIKELIDLNIIHEYRYCYSKKYNVIIRLFSIEPEIYQWKYWEGSTPILPSTAIRIISSNQEVCKKVCDIVRQINKKFTIEKSMLHFANYVYKRIISHMSIDVSKNIKQFSEMKKDISSYEYLNSYLIKELSKFDEFYGLNKDIQIKIREKNPELIDKILNLNLSSKFIKIKDYNVEKTLLANDKSDVSFTENTISYKRKNAFSSEYRNEVKTFISNDLCKDHMLTTDKKNNSSIDSLYNNINNKYNIDMKNNFKKDINDEVNNSAKKRGNIKMENNMCIKDIVPQNDSLVKKQKKIRKIKLFNGERKYKNHKDGWICNGLTGKTLGSRKDFIKTFKRIIKKHHKEVVFSNYEGYYPREMCCAGYVMDDLMKRNCNNESIAIEWMEWYAQVFLKNKKMNDPKYMSIEYLRKTWAAFDEVRRKDILIINRPKNSIINENSIIFRIEKMFNNDYCDNNILKVLKFFGVIVVSNYLRKKFGCGYNVENKIDSIFAKVNCQYPDNKAICVSIFNSTCKFLCEDFINNHPEVLLKDWVKRYETFWLDSGCSFDYYKKNNILIESEKDLAEDFFKREI